MGSRSLFAIKYRVERGRGRGRERQVVGIKREGEGGEKDRERESKETDEYIRRNERHQERKKRIKKTKTQLMTWGTAKYYLQPPRPLQVAEIGEHAVRGIRNLIVM